ncbi:hypothetical protein [Candidatus Nitrosocosmicus sp. T]
MEIYHCKHCAMEFDNETIVATIYGALFHLILPKSEDNTIKYWIPTAL